MRRKTVALATCLTPLVGCTLLDPYPGGDDPGDVLGTVTRSNGQSPLTGTAQDPLINPALDASISAVSNREYIIAYPGESFLIELDFVAQNRNVVGGGIQFPNSDVVQWTLLRDLEGETSGTIRFAYVVPEGICDDVANLCHEISTKQFAVGRNVSPSGDVDGDGVTDGDFVVSNPAEVSVVLKCASCDSPSCVDIFPGPGGVDRDWSCAACPQPSACAETIDLCFVEGRPKYNTEEADNFILFFGEDGIAWQSRTTCAGGTQLCDASLISAQSECP